MPNEDLLFHWGEPHYGLELPAVLPSDFTELKGSALGPLPQSAAMMTSPLPEK